MQRIKNPSPKNYPVFHAKPIFDIAPHHIISAKQIKQRSWMAFGGGEEKYYFIRIF